jgi:hypothetical protein
VIEHNKIIVVPGPNIEYVPACKFGQHSGYFWGANQKVLGEMQKMQNFTFLRFVLHDGTPIETQRRILERFPTTFPRWFDLARNMAFRKFGMNILRVDYQPAVHHFAIQSEGAFFSVMAICEVPPDVDGIPQSRLPIDAAIVLSNRWREFGMIYESVGEITPSVVTSLARYMSKSDPDDLRPYVESEGMKYHRVYFANPAEALPGSAKEPS